MLTLSRHFLAATALLATLAGCSSIDSNALSDTDLARRAAISLNLPDNEITVSDRSTEWNLGATTVHFTATTKKGNTHRCYVDVAYGGLVKTAAVCAGGACDDLRKAAGQCH